MQAITTKEPELRGSFRFHREFAIGVELMRHGLVDVEPLITRTVGVEESVAALNLAGDRSQSVKVQIAFS